MPEPKSMLEVTIEVNNLVASPRPRSCTWPALESLCGGERPYLNESVLELEHQEFWTKLSLSLMPEKDGRRSSFTGTGTSSPRSFDEAFNLSVKAHNDSKNTSRRQTHPSPLRHMVYSLLVTVLCFDNAVANSPTSATCWCGIVITGATWAYVKYSNVGSQIEDARGGFGTIFQVLS